MALRSLVILALALGIGFADTLTLRTGKQVTGTFLGGDARQIRMAVGDKVESYPVSEIVTLQFGGPASSSSAAAAAAPAPAARPSVARSRPLSPDPATSSTAKVVPAGTPLIIRMIDNVDSERHDVGQTFRASIDEPVVAGGETLIPQGADVLVKLVADKESGKLTGRTELTLSLVSITVGGKLLDAQTAEVTQASESRGRQTATRAGGGAAIGAIIGAIAGGGKGAAIGAATGAGAGTAVQVLTKGQQVKIPSETRLQFDLQQPLRI